MKYVIYIWDKNYNLLDQIFIFNSLNINFKLNEVSNASFNLKTSDKACNYINLKESNIVGIYKIEDNKEFEMFKGIIRGTDIDLNNTKIDLNCFNYLLKKKILYSDKNYVDKSISFVINDIVSEINGRDNGFINEVNCDIEELISIDFRSRKKFLDILKELAGDKYEFSFDGSSLIFSKTIGSDKTTGNNIVLFEFDKNTPKSRSIRNIKTSYDLENITNAVVGENGNYEDNFSILEFGRLEDGAIYGNSEDIVNEKKNSIKEIDLEPITNDFFICNIGDTIKAYINSGSELLDYNGNLKVIEKKFKTGKIDTLNLKLSSGRIISKGFLETISNLNSRVNNLEI